MGAFGFAFLGVYRKWQKFYVLIRIKNKSNTIVIFVGLLHEATARIDVYFKIIKFISKMQMH